MVLGDLQFFLSIEVEKVSNGLVLSQDKHDVYLLACVGMTIRTNCPTSLYAIDKLSLVEGKLLGPEDSSLYMSIAGV